MLEKIIEADSLLAKVEDDDKSGWVTRARTYLSYAIEAAQPDVSAPGNQIISAKEKTMELEFQTQMAKDTDEVAEYYRRLLLEARAERDVAIGHARTLAKHARVPDVVAGEEFPEIEHVAVLIEKYS